MRRLLEICIVALVYFATAKLGQTLAIPPGNVTPVWLPSGLMFAWAVIAGPRIWPGVFLGAFSGNVWAYFDPSSMAVMMQAIAAGFMNGVGDTLATVGAVWLLRRVVRRRDILSRLQSVAWFILIGVCGGSFISALFGVNGLNWNGFLADGQYYYVFMTWFVGDAIGVITIAPLLLVLVLRPRARVTIWWEAALNFLILNLSCVLIVGIWNGGIAQEISIILAPLVLLWAALRMGRRYAFFCSLYVATLAVVLTVNAIGPFVDLQTNLAIIDVQLFIGIMSSVVLFLSVSQYQQATLVHKLRSTQRHLEDRVASKTSELRDLVSRLEEAEAIAHVGHWEWDMRDGKIKCSEEALSIFNWDADKKLVFDDFRATIHPQDRDHVERAITRALGGHSYDFRHRILDHSAQEERTVREVGVIVKEDEIPILMKGIVQNISDEVEVERRVQQVHKIDALGHLAEGLAHDVHAMLLKIVSVAENGLLHSDQEGLARARLSQVVELGQNAREMIADIMIFGSRNAGQANKKVEDLTDVVAEALDKIRSVMPTKVKMDEFINPNTGKVSCERHKLVEAICNLAENSFDAMIGSTGRLDIMLEPIKLSERSDLQKIGLLPGEYGLITVRDTGRGMSKEIQSKIFDPFFSTKKLGKGAGLGLAVVYGVVDQHRGVIQVDSTQGEGTTFHIYLPLV